MHSCVDKDPYLTESFPDGFCAHPWKKEGNKQTGDLCEFKVRPGIHSKFQGSQSYAMRPCLKKPEVGGKGGKRANCVPFLKDRVSYIPSLPKLFCNQE